MSEGSPRGMKIGKLKAVATVKSNFFLGSRIRLGGKYGHI